MSKINEYPQAVTINNNDLFVIDQESGGDHATKSASVSQIADKATSGVQSQIGDLSTLTTTVKSSLVGAVNEIARYTPVYGNTASGAIATFDTSLALPLQDCTIAINAVQEGSGTPTPNNVRPITGFTGANITRCGKNWLNNPDITTTGSSYVINNVNVPMVAGEYYLSFDFSGTQNSSSLRIDDENGTAIFTTTKVITNGHNEFFINLQSKGAFVKLYSNAVGTYTNFQIELGNTSTTYEAYNGTTTPITWQTEAGTVSEGSLNVTTGKLTVVTGSMGAGEYQITPMPINQLSGTNNIFCDTGNTSVVYACSLKDYIDRTRILSSL